MTKRILLLIIILVSLNTAVYAEENSKKSEFFGVGFGCFIPQDIDFEKVYGDKRAPSFSLSYDKEISKGLAIGTSLMYYREDGFAVSRSFEKTTVNTTFTLLKAELSAVYRLTIQEDQLIVPQFKAGLSSTYFNEKIDKGDRTENVYWGYHAGFALLLLLDRLDPENAKSMKVDFGVDDTYLFIAMDYSNTDDFKERKLNLSGVEYSTGLMFRY